MSVTRVTSQMQHFDYLQCKGCNAVLPIAAVFCGQCGMRVDKHETDSSNGPLAGQDDSVQRYRITSLIRRRPAIQLSFALDTQLQRLIMLRDIDGSGLDEATRKLAYTELQQEYDLLQRQHIPDVMPLISSHSYKDHLYSVAGWPFSQPEGEAVISSIPSPRPYTLHDLLQSGIGIPYEQIATSWIAELAQAVERLHKSQIIIGELDPDIIIVSSHDYSGRPALMVSWLPTAVRHALLQLSPTVHPSSFRAPKTLYGQEDRLTDIYSLGALLYLLLTGTAPDPMGSSNPKHYKIRSPRVLNPHISRSLDKIVMQALALEPDKRFQHASELAEALLDLEKRTQIVRRPRITFALPPKSTPKFVEETGVSSDMDNNGSKGSQEALPTQESNDETVQIEDTQQLLARSYWSRINTGPLSSQEKSTGEATVGEIQIMEKIVENAARNADSLDNTRIEFTENKEKDNKKLSNEKNREKKDFTPVVASGPAVQNEIVQVVATSVEVVEDATEAAYAVPSLDAITSDPTEEVLIASSSSECTAEVQTSSESERSVEEGLWQEANLGGEQPQELVEEEVTVEQVEVKEEVSAEQEQVGVEEEQEQVGMEEEVSAEQEQVGVEEEVSAEQEQVGVEEEQEQVGMEEEVSAEQEQVGMEEEVSAEQEQVGMEEEVSAEQEQVGVEEEVSAEQEQVGVEEIAEEREQVKAERVTTEREQAREEEHVQQELVEAEEDVIDDKISIERINPQKVEEHQTDVYREGYEISTSQALVPQSTLPSGMLPALLPERNKRRALARIKNLFINTRVLLSQQIQLVGTDTNQGGSFLQRVQHFILGEQKHTTMAAALIETPMRIQPTQSYAIRIQIIGRDQLKNETLTGGLTALICGDIVHIEVRLALYQSYAYMVQQADVAIPASGYAAEVTVPMHPLSSGPASRRERLHIFFMDKERNPLYEKPFVIELFVSPLVQFGHEGHNVLSIPI